MRVGRMLMDEEASAGFYHCMSRVVERRWAFGDREKEKFVEIMRGYEEFCGVQVLTYCIMANHFHVVLEVPHRPLELPSDAELIRLVKRADLHYGSDNLERHLRELREGGDHFGAERLRERFFRRMWNLGRFMQSVKQRFSQWFNTRYDTRYDRTGTLWEGRFKSVLIEGGSEALAATAAYVDLNPVRAKLVEDPRDYRWCGYAEAVGGSKLAQRGLRKVVLGYLENEKPGESERQTTRRILQTYRVFLFKNGIAQEAAPDGTPARKGFSVKEVEAVIKAGGKLTLFETLRCRVRYFSDGCVIGSRAFVEEYFSKHRDRFGIRRRSGARPMRNVDLGGTFSVRDLRQAPVCPPGV